MKLIAQLFNHAAACTTLHVDTQHYPLIVFVIVFTFVKAEKFAFRISRAEGRSAAHVLVN